MGHHGWGHAGVIFRLITAVWYVCYSYDGAAFTKLGDSACRTSAPTVSGPFAGQHAGFFELYFVR